MAINWADQQLGKHLNFDNKWGAQCVDLFNYYVQHLTGVSPYNQGYGVQYATQLFERNSAYFSKTANDPNNANQLPQPGDILIFANGYRGVQLGGHVAIVHSADANGVTMVEQNDDGRATGNTSGWQVNGSPVRKNRYTWASIGRWCRGWLTYNGFTAQPAISAKTTTKKEDEMPVTREQIVNIYIAARGVAPTEPEILSHLNNNATAMDVVNAFLAKEIPEKIAAEKQEDELIRTLQAELANKDKQVSMVSEVNSELQKQLNEKTVVSTPPVKSANKLVLRVASLAGIASVAAELLSGYINSFASKAGVTIAPEALTEINVWLVGILTASALWAVQYGYKKGKKFII